MKRNSVFALVLTLLLVMGALPLKALAADGTDYEGEQAGQVSGSEQEAGTWRILLPEKNEQTGYVIKPLGSTAVPEGGSFTFSLSIADGYRKGKSFAVKAGDVVLKPDPPAAAAAEGSAAGAEKPGDGSGGNDGEPAGQNGGESSENQPAAAENDPAAGSAGTDLKAADRVTYTIPKITGNVTVTVTGVEKADAAGQIPEAGDESGEDIPQPEDGSDNMDYDSPEYEDFSGADTDGDQGADLPDGEDTVPEETPEEEPPADYDENQAGDLYTAYDDAGQEQSAYTDYGDGEQGQPAYEDYDDGAQEQPAYEDYDDGAQEQPAYDDDDNDAQEQPAYEDYDNGAQEQAEDPDGDAVSASAVNEGSEEPPSADDQEGVPAENTEDASAAAPADDTENQDGTSSDGSTGDPTETSREGVTETDASEGDTEEDAEESSGDAATGIDASEGDTEEDTAESSGDAATGTDDPTTEDTTADDTEQETTGPSDKEEKEFPFWVGGVRVSSGNEKDILKNKKVSYNDKTNTLTLNGAAIKSAGGKKAVIYYEGKEPLTIVLKGNNSLTEKGTVSGIMSAKGSVTIKGKGTLTIKTDAASSGAGICAKKGDVVLSGGTVSSSCTGGGAGIRARNIMVENGIKKVQASGKKDAFLAEKKISLAGKLEIISPKSGKLSGDGKRITDKDGAAAASAVIEPLPSLEVTFAPGEGSGAMKNQTVLKGRTLKLPKNGFTAPTCKKFAGWAADGKTFKAGASVRITKSVTFTAQWKDSHMLKLVKYNEPTCEDPGNIEYYCCAVCDRCFDDSEAKQEIQEKDTLIKPLGHEWDEPSYSWASDKSSVTAKHVCLRNSAHQQTETVKTVRTVVEPTCEKKGKYVYTATFSNKSFAVQKKNVELKALGHVWGNPEFTWSDKNSKCKVRLTCSRDSSHKKTVDAKVTGAYTLPTKTADGKIRYTASITLKGKEETATAETLISPAGDNDGYRFSRKESSWTKDSRSGISFTVKRKEYDAITYNAFSGIKVDGKTVASNDYTDSKGSLKLHLKAGFLDTLSEGDHTLLVEFKDGTVDTIFRVREKDSKSPRTGDDSMAGLWIAIAAAGCLGILAVLMLKRKVSK